MSDQPYSPLDPNPNEPSLEGAAPAPGGQTPLMTLIKKTLFSPSVETFSALLPEANMKRPLIWLFVVAIVAAILAALIVPLQMRTSQNMMELISQLSGGPGGAYNIPANFTWTQVLCAVPMAFAGTLISLFVVAGVFFLFGKLFGGQGSFTEMFFIQVLITISLSIIYYALYFLFSLGGLLPVVGGIFPFLSMLFGVAYTLWWAVVSAMGVAAVMRLTLGKGCLVVAIPYLLLILLVCCLTAGMMALMVPVFSQMGY